MGKYYFELLFRPKKLGEVKTERIISIILSSYLGNDDKTIKYIHDRKEYIYDYYFLQIQDSLFVSISYPLNQNERISAVKINVFQKFIEEITIEASKKGLYSTILFENASIYFIQKIIPYIHQYEWSLRKLIYLILNKDSQNESIKENISKETIQGVQERKRGNVDIANILQELTLYNFEDFLFRQNHVEIKFVSEEDEDTVIMLDKIKKESLIELISDNNVKSISTPFSLWEEFFHPYFENIKTDNVEKDVDIDQVKKDMAIIRDGRNTVGHNKEVGESLFNQLKTLLGKYINIFNFVFNLILSGEIEEEELEIAANEFESQFYDFSNTLNAVSSLDSRYIDTLDKAGKALNTIQGWDSDRIEGILKGINTSNAFNIIKPLDSGYIDTLDKASKALNTIQGWDSDRVEGILKGINTSNAFNIIKPLDSGYIETLDKAGKALNTIQGWDSDRIEGILKGVNASNAFNIIKPLDSGYINTLDKAGKALNAIQGWDSDRVEGILKGINTSNAINNIQIPDSDFNINQDKE